MKNENDLSMPVNSESTPAPDGLDQLLRAWHEENAAAAARSRDALLSRLRQEVPAARAHSQVNIGNGLAPFGLRDDIGRSHVMVRFAPAAAAAILLAALLTLIEPGLPGAPARTHASNVLMLPHGGNLDARTADGTALGPCPLRHTDVDVEVSGPFARVNVRQQFTNPYDDKIEAVYTFPLSHRGAVDRMTMTVGNRVIEGEVHERQAARQMYESARDAGHVAALLEQERPNIFTQSVANIEPGAEITVEISYVELLESRDGEYEFSFPMTVAPRYIPGRDKAQSALGNLETAGGPSDPAELWTDPNLDANAEPGDTSADAHASVASPDDGPSDAERISPPLSEPEVRSGHDISLSVTLDTGGPGITDVVSRLHETVRAIEAYAGDNHPRRMRITLDRLDEIPNRDFVLNWRTSDERITEAVFTHASELGGFVTLVLAPPAKIAPEVVVPRELVFVLDTSGSMSGPPIESAKAVITKALGTMHEGDTFNLITFSGDTHVLWSQPRPATDANIAEAQAFIESRQGDGGTEMMKAITAALEQPVDGPAFVRSAGELTALPADGRTVALRAFGRDIRVEAGAGMSRGLAHIALGGDEAIPAEAGQFADLERLAAIPELLWRIEGRWVQSGDEARFQIDRAETENATVHDDDAAPIADLCGLPADGRAVVVYPDAGRIAFEGEYAWCAVEGTTCSEVRIAGLSLSAETLASQPQWVMTGWWRNEADGAPALEIDEAGPLTIPGDAITAARLLTLPADGRTVFVRVNCENADLQLDAATGQHVEGLNAGFGDVVRAEGLSIHDHDEASAMLLTGLWTGGEENPHLVVESQVHIPRRFEESRPLRVVCFLTDGHVGNDQEIIDAVRKNSHTTRVFSFGTGTSVNRYLLDSIAQAGRGEAAYVLNMDEAGHAVDQFVARITAPVLTDIQVAFEGLNVFDVTPEALPDLWDERPIILHARYDASRPQTGGGGGALVIRGNASDGPYERILPLDLPANEPAHDVIATLWARAKVEEIMGRDLAAAQRGQFAAELKQQVVELGEAFQIMTPFTSFVAIERHRVTVGGEARLVRVPVELPEGQAWEGSFGQRLGTIGLRLEEALEQRNHTNREGANVLYVDVMSAIDSRARALQAFQAAYRELERRIRASVLDNNYAEARHLAEFATQLIEQNSRLILTQAELESFRQQARDMASFVSDQEKAFDDGIILSKREEIASEAFLRTREVIDQNALDLLESSITSTGAELSTSPENESALRVAQLMRRAKDQQRNRRFDDSVETLNQVLAINPYHEEAGWMRETLIELEANRRHREVTDDYGEQKLLIGSDADTVNVPFAETATGRRPDSHSVSPSGGGVNSAWFSLQAAEPTVDMWSVARANSATPKQFDSPSTTDIPDPGQDSVYYGFAAPDNLSYAYQYQHDADRRLIGTAAEPNFPFLNEAHLSYGGERDENEDSYVTTSGGLAGGRFIDGNGGSGGGGGAGGQGLFGGGGNDDERDNDRALMSRRLADSVSRDIDSDGSVTSTDDPDTTHTRERLRNTNVQVCLEKVALEDAIDELRKATGVSIVPDWSALEAVAIEKDAEVSLRLNNVSAEKVMEVMLEAVGGDEVELGYCIDEGVVSIAPKETLRQTTKTLVWNIADLMISVPTFRCQRMNLQNIGQQTTEASNRSTNESRMNGGIPVSERARVLMQMIEESIEPESWRERGGATGSIKVVPEGLEITHTAEAQERIGELLTRLRREQLFQAGSAREMLAAIDLLRAGQVARSFALADGLVERDPDDSLAASLHAAVRTCWQAASGAPVVLSPDDPVFSELDAIHAQAAAAVAREAVVLKALARKIDEPLLAWAMSELGEAPPAGVQLREGRAEVCILLAKLDDAAREALAQAGVTIEAEIPGTSSVVGLAPLASLRPMALMENVRRVEVIE